MRKMTEACHTFMRPSTRAFIEAKQGWRGVRLFQLRDALDVECARKGEQSGFVLIRALEPAKGNRPD